MLFKTLVSFCDMLIDDVKTSPQLYELRVEDLLGAEDRTWTGTIFRSQDFKSCASAYSATPAWLKYLNITLLLYHNNFIMSIENVRQSIFLLLWLFDCVNTGKIRIKPACAAIMNYVIWRKIFGLCEKIYWLILI